eukprot:scpid54480/ scgid26706/ 
MSGTAAIASPITEVEDTETVNRASPAVVRRLRRRLRTKASQLLHFDHRHRRQQRDQRPRRQHHDQRPRRQHHDQRSRRQHYDERPRRQQHGNPCIIRMTSTKTPLLSDTDDYLP